MTKEQEALKLKTFYLNRSEIDSDHITGKISKIEWAKRRIANAELLPPFSKVVDKTSRGDSVKN